MDFQHHPDCIANGRIIAGTLGLHDCLRETGPTRADNGDLYATYESLGRRIYYFEGQEIGREEFDRKFAAAQAA